MKTKTFFFLCLFMGIGLTKLSGQPAIGKSGSVIVDETFFGFSETVPLNCDFTKLILLEGTVRCHSVLHYSNFDGNPDNWAWIKQDFHGELVLKATNEVFKVNDMFAEEGPNHTLTATGHFNVFGNQGSHYIVNYLWNDWADPTNIIFVSVKCPGGK
jgi:hypothetical protein